MEVDIGCLGDTLFLSYDLDRNCWFALNLIASRTITLLSRTQATFAAFLDDKGIVAGNVGS